MRGDRRAGREVRGSGQAVRCQEGQWVDRGGAACALPFASDQLQVSAGGRIPRRAAEIQRRQDIAPPASRRAEKGGCMNAPAVTLPDTEPALRVVPMPADANQHGDIFGGWVMSQVDIAGSIPASRRARGRVATVAVNSFVFKEPVLIGDVVSFYAKIDRVGRTSITVSVEVYAQRNPDAEITVKVTEASLTYVAVGPDRRPRELPAER